MNVDPTTLVPRDKADTATAIRATQAGYPTVAPVLAELFEWLKDGNWPVSAILGPFLARIGTPIVPEVRRILATSDDIWKYWVLVHIAAESSSDVINELRDGLLQVGHSPTKGELEEEVDALARELLERLDDESRQ